MKIASSFYLIFLVAYCCSLLLGFVDKMFFDLKRMYQKQAGIIDYNLS